MITENYNTEYVIQIDVLPTKNVWYNKMQGHVIVCRLDSCASVWHETDKVYSTMKFFVLQGQQYPAGNAISLEDCRVIRHYPVQRFF
ncbi:hypothetical protein [Runella zeae]|uniref:hypothetical protein n=1 Tax=Runella zeae TaxID=94255 RepID=UPI002354580A|nr:hypothetical protein [Runella zeae]